MRIFIASDNDEATRVIRETLSRYSLDCPAGYVAALEVAAERAHRLAPDLLLLSFPPDAQDGPDPDRSENFAGNPGDGAKHPRFGFGAGDGHEAYF
ncbi:MAG: hypothetical protein ACWGMZ_04505 [Thermoguttaceae bacterium]